MKFQVNRDIPVERIQALLVAAFEGGSNYWYQIRSYVYAPDQLDVRVFEDVIIKHVDFPLNGGAVLINACDRGEMLFRLDSAAIQRGLQTMNDKFSKHFDDMMNERDDAETGDVFLQCCLFGDVIYG